MPKTTAAAPADRKTAGILLDDEEAEFTGMWKVREKLAPLVGSSYRVDDRGKKELATAKFTPSIPEAGRYELRLLYVPASNRASNVTITIRAMEGEKTVVLNQREACFEDGIPRALGTFAFAKGKAGTIEISNANADGFVVVDALQLVLEPEAAKERNTRSSAGFPMQSSSSAVPVKIPPPMLLEGAAKPSDVNGKSYDLVVIGGTPGGIACAVRAAREGLNVLLVNHTQHLGGFVTSGAGGWEAPYDGQRAPLYAEMLEGAANYYRKNYGEGSPQHVASMPSKTSRAHIDRPKVEPRIAEMLFNKMVGSEKSLTVLLGHVVTKAERDGALIKSVTLKPMHGDNTITVIGKVFADGMYEGDLMAAAGVKTQIGRESRAQYGEKHAGVIYTQERHKEPGQRGFPKAADEGTLNIRYNSHATADILEGPHSGEADGSVMSYNYRLVLTRDPANKIMVEKPANYDASIAKAAGGGGFVPNLPNGKVAWNGGRLIGPQNDYPAAEWPKREEISRRYLESMLMRLWWMQNDPEAPEKERKQFAGYASRRMNSPTTTTHRMKSTCEKHAGSSGDTSSRSRTTSLPKALPVHRFMRTASPSLTGRWIPSPACRAAFPAATPTASYFSAKNRAPPKCPIAQSFRGKLKTCSCPSPSAHRTSAGAASAWSRSGCSSERVPDSPRRWRSKDRQLQDNSIPKP
nr:FAD-dependent oxidoreductase [Verrucomicrobium spinosum]